MDPFFHTGLSISDSLKTVQKSVLIYETIIGERALTSLSKATGCCAENLAKYQTSVTQVMDCWKESSGHNANMISKYTTSVAISVFVKAQKNDDGTISYTYHYVQLFGW